MTCWGRFRSGRVRTDGSFRWYSHQDVTPCKAPSETGGMTRKDEEFHRTSNPSYYRLFGERLTKESLPPIVGSLFSWKSLLTNRRTREDCKQTDDLVSDLIRGSVAERMHTFPTAASPSSTSLTLLLGLGAFAPADSDMAER